MIDISVSEVSLPVPIDLVEAVARGVLDAEEQAGSVAVVFVGNEASRTLHRDYLGVDEPTDTIAFPLEGGADDLIGEAYINVDRAREVAAEESIPEAEELLRYVIHALLHLCGWDDGTDDEHNAMWARQEELLTHLRGTH